MKLKDVIISEANGEKIAVSVGGSFNGMLKLNETAAFIADLLKQETTVEEVAQKICEVYATDMETATKSVESVTEQFRKVGLIEE